jgi:predicted XRE-type DNA-binding protein
LQKYAFLGILISKYRNLEKYIRKLVYEKSAGNVFADLKVEKPEEALAKSELARQIAKIIRIKKLTQKQAAEILGIDQPKISALIHGRLRSFSLERLMKFLSILGHAVGIVVDPVKSLSEKNDSLLSSFNYLDQNHLTDRQSWLFQKLCEYELAGETYTLGQIYLNGINVLKSATSHKFVFSAHCFREIIEKFPKIIIKKDKVKSLNNLCKNLIELWDDITNQKLWKNKIFLSQTIDDNLSNFLSKFEQFKVEFIEINPKRADRIGETINNICSSSLPLPLMNLKKVVDIWLNLDSFFQSVSHHGKITDEKEYQIKLDGFELLFFELLKPKIFEDFQEIDSLIFRIENSDPIDKALTENLLLKISKPSSFEYFINNLKSDRWVKILKDLHPEILKNPFDSITTKDGTTYPTWPISKYFLRIANQHPKLITILIKEIKPTDNFRVHIDFIDCALKMPIEQAVEIGKLAVGWIRECQYERLPKKCIQLALKLALGNKHGLSLSLVEEVLQLQDLNNTTNTNREAVTKIDQLDLQNILKNELPNLVNVIGENLIFLLIKILNGVLLFEDDVRMPAKDLSHIWRPQIKDNSHLVNQYSYKNLLINAILDCSLKFIKTHPTKALQIIDKFFEFPIGIFYRIGICIANSDEIPKPKVKQILFDKLYYQQESTWAEFYNLLSKKFKSLSNEEQNNIFTIIFQDSEAKDREVWQYRALTAIKDYLPDNLSKKYLLLEEKYKNIIVGGIIFSSYSWVGPTSSISDEEFEQKNYKELFEYLKSWVPSTDPFGPSREGLNRQLSERIRKNPQELLSVLNNLEMQSLHPIFLSGLVRGIFECQTVLKWQNILVLCSNIITNFKNENSLNSEGNSFEWVVIDILRLLQKGLVVSEFELPFNKRKAVWNLIRKASKFIYHREKEEIRYLEKSNDYYTYSINSAEGQTVNAIFQYALWVRNHLHINEQHQGLKFIPEIEEILTRFLRVKIVSQVSLHGIYGRWFPWLVLIDNDFAKQLLPKIFIEKHPERREAAWQSYLLYCHAYDTSFELLIGEYQLYLTSLRSHEIVKTATNIEIARRYSDHLMQLFYRKKISIHSSDNLIKDFFSLSRLDLIEYSIQNVGTFMKKDKSILDVSSQEILVAFWNFLSEHKNDAVSQSLQQFGYWFISEKLPIEWSIDTLIHVLKKMGSIEPERKVLLTMTKFLHLDPKRSLDFAYTYFQTCIRKRLHWFYHSEFHQLLFQLKGFIKNPDDKKILSDLIHLMGDAGHMQFKSLLS